METGDGKGIVHIRLSRHSTLLRGKEINLKMSIRGISLLAASALSVFAAPVRVLNVDFPDPSLIKTDDGWYSFATAGNGVQVQVATSSDFKTWELLKGHDAIPGPFPDWTKKEGPEVWAPDVIKRVRLFPPS